MITTCINYLRYNRGLSENTCKSYDEALRDFASYINDVKPGTSWRTVTKQMIDSYVLSMVEEGHKPATIKQHISALRTFFKTIQANGGMQTNPARFVSTPKLTDSLPKTIEIEAIAKVLKSNGTSDQAKAAIAIIFETGIRLQELLDLRKEDINPTTQSIRIHGKGDKERTVYYGDLTKIYGRKWNPKNETQRHVRHIIYQALKPVSKAPQLSPHALRHTYATEMLNNGAKIEVISKLLGHKYIETTQVYARMGNKQTEEEYLKFMPKC